MIKIGSSYLVKLTKCKMPVRIEYPDENGIWVSRSLLHGRVVLVKNESQIIRECSESDLVTYAKKAVPQRSSKKKRRKPAKRALPTIEMPVATPQRPPAKRRPFVPEFGLTLVEAAYQILCESQRPLTSKEIVELALKKKMHRSRGATPDKTIHAALLRIIKKEGEKSRFKKVGRGLFTAR